MLGLQLLPLGLLLWVAPPLRLLALGELPRCRFGFQRFQLGRLLWVAPPLRLLVSGCLPCCLLALLRQLPSFPLWVALPLRLLVSGRSPCCLLGLRLLPWVFVCWAVPPLRSVGLQDGVVVSRMLLRPPRRVLLLPGVRHHGHLWQSRHPAPFSSDPGCSWWPAVRHLSWSWWWRRTGRRRCPLRLAKSDGSVLGRLLGPPYHKAPCHHEQGEEIASPLPVPPVLPPLRGKHGWAARQVRAEARAGSCGRPGFTVPASLPLRSGSCCKAKHTGSDMHC